MFYQLFPLRMSETRPCSTKAATDPSTLQCLRSLLLQRPVKPAASFHAAAETRQLCVFLRPMHSGSEDLSAIEALPIFETQGGEFAVPGIRGGWVGGGGLGGRSWESAGMDGGGIALVAGVRGALLRPISASCNGPHMRPSGAQRGQGRWIASAACIRSWPACVPSDARTGSMRRSRFRLWAGLAIERSAPASLLGVLRMEGPVHELAFVGRSTCFFRALCRVSPLRRSRHAQRIWRTCAAPLLLHWQSVEGGVSGELASALRAALRLAQALVPGVAVRRGAQRGVGRGTRPPMSAGARGARCVCVCVRSVGRAFGRP